MPSAVTVLPETTVIDSSPVPFPCKEIPSCFAVILPAVIDVVVPELVTEIPSPTVPVTAPVIVTTIPPAPPFATLTPVPPLTAPAFNVIPFPRVSLLA